MFHAHTPWIMIVVRKMKEWQDAHGGAMPDMKQRAEFQQRWAVDEFMLRNSGKVPNPTDVKVLIHPACCRPRWSTCESIYLTVGAKLLFTTRGAAHRQGFFLFPTKLWRAQLPSDAATSEISARRSSPQHACRVFLFPRPSVDVYNSQEGILVCML